MQKYNLQLLTFAAHLIYTILLSVSISHLYAIMHGNSYD